MLIGNDILYFIHFESVNSSYTFELARTHDPKTTKEYYEGCFVNYDKANFCTIKYAGLNISEIKAGKYRISLTVKAGLLEETIPLSYLYPLKLINITRDFRQTLKTNNSTLYYIKTSLNESGE